VDIESTKTQREKLAREGVPDANGDKTGRVTIQLEAK
jgi:hypothetical protein